MEQNLIEELQSEQDKNGYLSEDAIGEIAKRFNRTPVSVLSVASFYSRFRFKPAGLTLIHVCVGTACHINGADAVLHALCDELEIKIGGTTRDGQFTLESVSCLGCCSLAPVMTVDGTIYGDLTPEEARKIISEHRREYI